MLFECMSRLLEARPFKIYPEKSLIFQHRIFPGRNRPGFQTQVGNQVFRERTGRFQGQRSVSQVQAVQLGAKQRPGEYHGETSPAFNREQQSNGTFAASFAFLFDLMAGASSGNSANTGTSAISRWRTEHHIATHLPSGFGFAQGANQRLLRSEPRRGHSWGCGMCG